MGAISIVTGLYDSETQILTLEGHDSLVVGQQVTLPLQWEHEREIMDGQVRTENAAYNAPQVVKLSSGIIQIIFTNWRGGTEVFETDPNSNIIDFSDEFDDD
jgi:hypothetical protein